jgi:hypothetical protein
MRSFLELVSLHLTDNIYEVRDAAAFAMKILIQDLPTDDRKEVLADYEKVKFLKNSADLDSKFQIEKDKIFQKVKDNENDFGFMREPELWEFVDGLVHLYKEIFDTGVFNKEASLSEMIDFMCLNYSKPYMTNMCKKTVWECLASMFSDVNKSEIEMYFDYIQKTVIKEIEGISILIPR